MSALVLESELTCPRCSFVKRETMSTDTCQFLYECENCNTLLRPNPGDCCVFCSFGSVKCPPVKMRLSAVCSNPLFAHRLYGCCFLWVVRRRWLLPHFTRPLEETMKKPLLATLVLCLAAPATADEPPAVPFLEGYRDW